MGVGPPDIFPPPWTGNGAAGRQSCTAVLRPGPNAGTYGHAHEP
jgi:hypothetical protein